MHKKTGERNVSPVFRYAPCVLEHDAERNRHEFDRAAIGLDLGVLGFDECIETAERHADAAADVPAEIILRSAADTGDGASELVPARSTEQVGRD